jgi:hypothetical protein
MPHHGPEVTRNVFELLDAGKTEGEVQRLTGVPQPTQSRWLKQRRIKGEPSEPPGEPDEAPQPIATVHPSEPPGEPITALQRVELLGEPGEPGLPDIARQSDLDDLKTRAEVLEAFIASLRQQPTMLPGSPNGSPVVHPVHSNSPSGSPTHKRGFVLAVDLWEAIHRYADTHHRQIAQVVDLVLRTFFAAQGKAMDGDA